VEARIYRGLGSAGMVGYPAVAPASRLRGTTGAGTSATRPNLRPVDAVSRARLVSRIELEARAYFNADSTMKAIRWGGLLGLLEAGVVLGYWSRRKAGGVSEAVRNALPAWRLRRMLAKL
jgi:hypothetical protein